MTESVKDILLMLLTQSGLIGIVTAALLSKYKKERAKTAALYKGMQALLRHELYDLYTEYKSKRGYAPVYVKEDFENMYRHYHELGANGVMDGIHEEFQKLPTDGEQHEE